MNSELFNLKLSRFDWGYNGNPILKQNKGLRWLKYILGCMPVYHCEVLSPPVPIGDSWEYKIKLVGKTYRIFGIKIKTIFYNEKTNK